MLHDFVSAQKMLYVRDVATNTNVFRAVLEESIEKFMISG